MRTFRVGLAALLFALAALNPAGAAAAKSAKDAAEAATPAEVQALIALLAEPKVQAWLAQHEAKPAAAPSPEIAEESVSHLLDARLATIRAHIAALARTIPDLPHQFWRGRALVTADLGQNGRLKALLLLAFFVGLGSGVEWLFRKATARWRARLDTLALETVADRLRLVGLRFAVAVGLVAAFALGSIGPFLARDWPPLLREMLFGCLAAFLAVRIALVVGHFLLAPDYERFRIIPMDGAAARFWCRRLVAFVAWLAFGWVTVGFGVTLGYSLEGRQLVAYALGLGLVAIALEAVWRRPAAPSHDSEAPSPATHSFGRGAANTALTVGVVLLWVLWVIHAAASLWLVLVGMTLPLAIGVSRRAVENLLRPAGSPQGADGPPSVLAVCIERGIRALLILGAVAILAWGWDVDLAHFRGEESLWAGSPTAC